MPVTQARLPGFQSAKSARWYQALIGPIQATGSAGGFDFLGLCTLLHTFCTPAGKPCFSLHCLHSVHRERFFHTFSGEQQSGKLTPLLGVHLSDNFQHPFRGDLDAVRQIFFYRHRAGFGGTDVL